MSERAWAFVRTLLFVALVPGTVGVLVPELLIRANGVAAPLVPGLGLALAAAGAALVLWSAFGFAFIGRGTPAPFDPPREVVVWGPYRWVRNPMYLGVVALILGQAVAASSVAVTAYAAACWLAFHAFVVVYEEPTLASRFGASYAAYKRRVPRWVPRLIARDAE